MQGPCHSVPTRAPDVVVLDNPRGDLVEFSSNSYGLSLFSAEAGSHKGASARATPRGSPSISIGDLWPDINKLDEAGYEGTSGVAAPPPPTGKFSLAFSTGLPKVDKSEGGCWA
jgi:hypothetical protein